MIPKALLTFVVAGAMGCTGQIGAPAGLDSEPASGDGPETKAGKVFDVASLSPLETSGYLAKLALPLVGRVLTSGEQKEIEAEGGAAIDPILQAWSEEDGFVRAGRTMIEQRLSVGGTSGDVDFDMPGRTVAHVIKQRLPWSTILTSDTCYDAADQPTACDTGAPYAAGVLATRAYLISRRGRFNLTRASTMMKTFACRGYPMEDTLEPRLPKEKLLPMFRATNAAEQTDPKAKSGFGNGQACYTCHGQFGAHAQIYVKFDETGIWREDATGQQDPDGELGRSFDGLFASQMFYPADAASEHSQMFGQKVDNMAGAAKVLVSSPTFVQCAARNVLEYSLMIDQSVEVSPSILEDIAARASEAGEPTFGDIVAATLTSPEVVKGVVEHVTGESDETGGEP